MAEVSFEAIQLRQATRLKMLLETVTEKTEFYRKYRDFESLEDFPVVNKLIIRDNFNRINLPVGSKDRIPVKTSGSTGIPFEIYQTRDKKNRNTADTIYFSRLAGFEIGYRLLYLRHWSAYYKKPAWLAYLQRIDQLEVEDLTDSYLRNYLGELIKDSTPKSWHGQASGFEKIVKYLERQNAFPLDANIKSIVASSEALFDDTRQKMEYYFKCPVVSRYSNVENGILAQQAINAKSFTLNWASYVFEVLKLDSDQPASSGELGRIVITDLFNYATPLIRYDTGDLGILGSSASGIPILERIDGRKSDVLTDTSGTIISPFVFHGSLSAYTEITQMQLIQNGLTYTFRLNTSGKDFSREQEFINHYAAFFGSGAIVRVVYVNEIPVLQSGKRKLIVNKGA